MGQVSILLLAMQKEEGMRKFEVVIVHLASCCLFRSYDLSLGADVPLSL